MQIINMKYLKLSYVVFIIPFFLNLVTSQETVAIYKTNNKYFSGQETLALNSDHSLTCRTDQDFAYCINAEYDKNIGPWRFRHLTNSSLPWYFNYHFTIFDVLEVDDNKQTVSMDMYVKIKWIEPRLRINASSSTWSTEAVNIDGEDYVTISLDHMIHFWSPMLEIAWLELYRPQNVLKATATLRVTENKLLRHISRVKITVSCQMDFRNYPFDSQQCRFLQGSFQSPQEIVDCTSVVSHRKEEQRGLQYDIRIMDLHPEDHTFETNGRVWARCGFNIKLKRQITRILFDVYLTAILLVIASWVSFTVDPNSIPGRMGLLITVFLVLINIFIGVKHDSPKSSGFLNAVDVFLVVCIGEVFGAFIEFAVVLYWFRQPNKCTSASIASPSPVKLTKEYDTSLQNQTPSATNAMIKNCWMDEVHVSMEKYNLNILDQISIFLYPISFLIFIVIYLNLYLK